MTDTNINIIFRNGPEPGNESSPDVPGSTPNPEDPTQQKEESGKSASFSTQAMALYIGKQGMNMATSRVGQVTRSSAMQQKVNSIIKIGAYAGMIAANWPLGLAALAGDLINSGIDYSHNSRVDQIGTGVALGRSGNVNRSR